MVHPIRMKFTCSGATITSVTILAILLIGKIDDSVASSARNGPYHAAAVHEWIQSKCGADGSPGLWAYEGALYDPMTGNRICNVEGMEIVTPLASCEASNEESCGNFRSKCKSLAIPRLLFPDKMDDSMKQRTHKKVDDSNEWDYATTVLSRKIFCYKKEDQLIQKIKAHPTAPTRQIPRSQAMVIWDAATTYVSRGKEGRELYIHTEQPNASCLSASAVATPHGNEPDTTSPSRRLFDFTIYTKRKRGSKFGLPPLVSAGITNNTTMTASPPRSKLIQFGSGKKELLDKFGARETYSFSIPIQQEEQVERGWLSRFRNAKSPSPHGAKASVLYTRYGEGPPWLGPGRMCTLELRGQRIDSIRQAPPLLYETCFSNARDLAKFLPSFLPKRAAASPRLTQKKPAIDENQDLVVAQEHNAVALFREGGGSLRKDETKGGGLYHVWSRIRSATTSVDN